MELWRYKDKRNKVVGHRKGCLYLAENGKKSKINRLKAFMATLYLISLVTTHPRLEYKRIQSKE